MNYQLISAIVKSFWAIHPDIAQGFLPFVGSILSPGAVVTEFTERDNFKLYSIERSTLTYSAYDKNWNKAPKNSIAVIPIHGVLMREDQNCGPVGMETIAQAIINADASPNIDGILLTVDTPGGTVDGAHQLQQAIKNTKKPIVSYIKGMMASGGIWTNASTDLKIAESNRTVLGSVGVITNIVDYKPALEKQGVKFHTILATASTNKQKHWDQIEKGNYDNYRKEVLDPIAQDFIQLVKENYPNVTEEHLKGDVFYAKNVVGVFIDAIGNFDFALAELNKLINEQKQTANSNIHLNNYAMEKQYSKVNAALGVETLEGEEAGIYLQEDQIAALEAALDQSATEEKLIQLQNDLTNTQAIQSDLQEKLETAQANNARLIKQIENAGAAKAAGTSKTQETIEGANEIDEFENAESTKYARAKLSEY